MSNNKLTIDACKLIRDAFYAIPDFTDGEGNHISGIYGALYKLHILLSEGNYELLDMSFDCEESDLTENVIWQIGKFKEVMEEACGRNELTDIPVSDLLLAEITDRGAGFSPTGKTVNVPRFSFKSETVYDFVKAEEIFAKALETGRKDTDSFVGYQLIYETTDKAREKTLLGISICYEEGSVFYIPAVNFVSKDYIGNKLSQLSSEVSLSTFDIKKDYYIYAPSEFEKRTEGYGHDVGTSLKGPHVFDTLIGAYICNPIKNDYKPEDISSEYLGISLEKQADLFGKTKLSEADENKLSDYACKLAYVAFASAPLIKKKLQKTDMEKLFYEIEMPLSYILFAMEKEGIIAKADELKTYGEKLSVRIGELEKAIYEAAGVSFNINSPKQLGEVLFEKLGLPAEKKTKSGYSTAADVLEKLAPEHRIVADILEYRGLAKLKSTYADGLSAYIEEDGRIHTSFNQTITATGRISSTEPNLQNIPMRTELGRLIRKVFVPKEGYVFADADYSQIELRILAHMSEDQGLIGAYHEGDDIHRITASKVFHVPFDEVTPLQRRNAKAVNFGIVYGMSSFGLSQDLSISVGEAREYMEKYFETYPGVRTYQDGAISSAKAKGYSVTLFGRRRPIPELKAGNFNLRQFGERVAMNAPIQGTAADIMKIAMINVFFRLKRENMKSRLILQIHDELVIETAPDETEAVTNILTEEMESAVTLSVPMDVDCHTGSDWYEAK